MCLESQRDDVRSRSRALEQTGYVKTMGVLFGYLGLALVLALAVLGPMVIGRWLSDRDHELEAAEVAALDACALAMLAGRVQESG